MNFKSFQLVREDIFQTVRKYHSRDSLSQIGDIESFRQIQNLLFHIILISVTNAYQFLQHLQDIQQQIFSVILYSASVRQSLLDRTGLSFLKCLLKIHGPFIASSEFGGQVTRRIRAIIFGLDIDSRFHIVRVYVPRTLILKSFQCPIKYYIQFLFETLIETILFALHFARIE